ncbi:MAG: hypothetical protein H0W73_04890 [Bacteroidetes bacterium]|nr:hypothetical protein [Bacteroidota bacterium]
MILQKRILSIGLLAVLMLFSNWAFGFDKPIRLVATPALENGPSTIITGNSQLVFLNAPSATSYDKEIIGTVKLQVKTNAQKYLAPYDAEISLQVTTYNASNVIISNAVNVLKVSHQPFTNAAYKDQDYLIFNSQTNKVYKIVTTITQIKINNVVQTTLPDNLLIESTLDYLRYNTFSYNTPVPPPIVNAVDQDGDNVDDILEITWSPMTGAVSYDMEYTSINDYDINNIAIFKPANTLNFDFKNNSTRIVTTGNSYTVPLIFDHGYFLCRVRGVGKDISGTNPSMLPYNGNWSYNTNTGLVSAITSAPSGTGWVALDHFEIKKNWQYNATFAEEGKHKDVINYADGSLRSRQTITKINSDNSTIIGENVYDYTGRSAVNILPVPFPTVTINNVSESFLYKPNFNISDVTGLKYSKEDFDLDNITNVCTPNAAGLSTSSGASKYYSPNNPNKTAYQAFVPDAQKFPFTQVEYTPDNTGRIKKQSGVGINHQLGSGHETKYFYGSPEQIEIDRLFGSEVGSASHYQKNMVIDANGQVSITYMDMEGKTIATSLAGGAPANMLPMPKQPPTAILLKADMFNKDAFGESESNLVNAAADAITFNKSILITDQAQNVFTYNMSIGTFNDPCLKPNVCFNCVYDFELKVTNDCGDELYSTVTGGKKMIGRFNVINNDTLFTTLCYNPVTYNYTEVANTTPQLNLAPGVYYVSKTLKINTDARDFYLSKYLSKTYNSCIKDLNDFQTEALNVQGSTDCAVSCQSCFTKLGTKDNFVALGKGTEEEWQEKYDECKAFCGYPKSTCEINLGILLVDVSPNGQYGEYLTANDPLSVFNQANLLPKNIAQIPNPNPSNIPPSPLNVVNNINNGPVVAKLPTDPTTAYWKKPIYYKTNAHIYVDKKGVRYKVLMAKIPNGPNPGNYSYAVDNHLTQVFATPTVGLYYTYPEFLTNLDDFISIWQASFAKSLVTYHPEYCYYEDCLNKFGVKNGTDTITSNDFDSKLLFTQKLQSAIAKQLVIPNGNGGYKMNLQHDPVNHTGYFSPTLNNSPSLLEQKYINYSTINSVLTLDQFVAYTLKCGTQFASSQSNVPLCVNLGMPISGTPTQVLDMQNKEWNTLKAIYFGEKQKLLYDFSNARRLNSASGCNYYNACIGDPNFDGYSSPMVKYNQLPGNVLNVNSQYFHATQPCNQAIKDLYVNKVKRFGYNKEDQIDENEAAYQAYLQTGKCPVANDLQNLMHALAQNGKLTGPTSEALQNYPQMTVNFYNYINNATPPATPYTSYLSVGTLQSGNTLHIDIKKALTNTTVKFVELYQPFPNVAGFLWPNVQGVSQFMHTGVNGPHQTFSCTVQVLIGSTLYYKTVTGKTDIKLDGCMFNDVCKPNDLAKQLQTVMSALKSTNNFNNTSPYTLGAPAGNTFYGPYLQKVQQLIGQSAVTPSFKWQNVSASTLSYELFDATTPNCKLKINLLTINNNPVTAANLVNVTSFKKIRSDYQNFFAMEARDANNTLIGIIKGEVFKICGSTPIPISMGTCDKPDPASCKTPFHQNRKDLEVLLKDVLEIQKYWPNANAIVSNIVTNVNLTTNLIGNFQPLNSNIPTTKYVVTNNFHRILTGETFNIPTVNNDSVTFTLKSPCIVPTPTVDPNPNPNALLAPAQIPQPPPCVETIYCKIWLKTNNKSVTGSLDINNLSVVKKLVACGTVNNNNYNDFYLLVDYNVNNTIVSDTLFGSSCYELQNCNPCSVDLNLPTVQALPSQQSNDPAQADSAAVAIGIATRDSSLVRYTGYTNRVTTLNNTMSWSVLDTSFIQPIPYIEMKSKGYEQVLCHYNEFIEKFDTTIDNRMYLKSISCFARDFGYCHNPKKAYTRYLNATNKYNLRALAVNANTLSPMADTVFYKSLLLDSINVYIDYLLASPAPSVSTQQAPAFFAARAGIPGPSPCQGIYNQYITAYNQFVSNPANIANCGTPPLLALQAFIDGGYCCPPSNTEWTTFINSFYTANACLVFIQKIDNCVDVSQPDIKVCVSTYNSYLTALNQYNLSVYAAANNSFLSTNLFADITSFYQQGYCNCVNAYITYLNQFIVANSNSQLTPPVSIKNWSGCGPGEGSNTCDETYNNYLTATNNFLAWLNHNPLPGLQQLPVTYDISEFTYNGFCYCAGGYISFLNGIVSGAVTNINYINQNMSIGAFCNQKPIVCPNPNSMDTIVSPPVPPGPDPCVQYQANLAMANGALAYQQYVTAQTTQFIAAYNKYCLGTTESLERDYESKEFHYTLYYYDQAGNLIRTIPPEGLDVAHYTSIVAYNSLKEQQIKADRAYKTKTVFTSHGMATTYQYNSLNQLVKQKMPDHEALSYLKYKYNYGIDTTITIVTSQFPDQNKGYLGGNETYTDPFIGTVTRGKIFESTDGSLSWKGLGNIAGTDIKKTQFLTVGTTNYGFAVGSDGAFLFTIDGGANWDYYPVHEFSKGNSDLNDLYFYDVGGSISGYIVGDNGTIIKAKFNGTASFHQYENIISPSSAPAFSANDNITDITADANNNLYITVLNKTTNTSKIYSSNGNGNVGTWTDITATRLPNLNKVRRLKNTATYYAAGGDGNLLKSVDNGATWVLQETNTALNFTDVYFATATGGVAILQDINTGIGSLYKTNDGGTNWTQFDAGTATKNYASFSPYINTGSATIDKLTANATTGIVKRITINYTTPANVMVGAVTTAVGTLNQVNDVCVVPYDIQSPTNYKEMAIAVTNNGLHFCLDYAQNTPVWSAVSAPGINFKKALFNIQTANTTPVVDGLALSTNGSLYSLGSNVLNNNVTPVTVFVSPLAATSFAYSDMVFDLTNATPYTEAYLLGKNTANNTLRFAHMPLNNVGAPANPNPVTFNSTSNIAFNSLSVNKAANSMLAVGTSGDILSGNPANIVATTQNTNLNTTDNSTKITPVQLNDIAFDITGNNIAVFGNDGYYAERPVAGNNPFQVKNSTITSDITAAKYAGLTFGGAGYSAVSKQGEFMILISQPANPALIYAGGVISASPLNDVDVKTNGTNFETYVVGDNATAYFKSNSAPTFAQVFVPGTENINCAAFYPGASIDALFAGNNTTAFDISGQSSIYNRNWYTNQVNKLHFTDAANGYFVGMKGLTRHTNDGGLTWKTVKPYINASNNSIDLYAVYTTTANKAVIAGANNYISNLNDLTLATLPVIGGNGNANQVWYDIDLCSTTNGFAVGRNANSSAAIQKLVFGTNNQVASASAIISTATNEVLRAVYAFKDPLLTKFIAVGENSTLKMYNGTGFAAVSYAPAPNNLSTVFNGTDIIYDIDLSDNNSGYMVGTRSRFVSIDVNTTSYSVFLKQLLPVNPVGPPPPGYNQITNNTVYRSVSLIDDGNGFFGGNRYPTAPTLAKIAWKFTHEKGQTSTLFWYDRLGRMVLSQNTKQINKTPKAYSYTTYDALGRITEVGEKAENTVAGNLFDNIFGTYVGIYYNTNAISDIKLDNWIQGTGARTDVTHTFYDNPYFTTANCPLPATFVQDNLRKRVASITFEDVYDNNPCTYNHATHYSYDIHGNVKNLLQDNKAMAADPNIAAQRFKRIDYDYDLISGKVNMVSYQPGQPDAFYHRYNYDDDNRITEVTTSRNGNVWEADAKYFYYLHGPLARTEYGHDKVQGMDHAYTLQGWIKGVNSNSLKTANDIGKDGDGPATLSSNTNTNKLFAQDAMGYSLGYFSNDYTPIDNSQWLPANRFEAVTAGSSLEAGRYNLYNGNIGHMATTIVQPLNLTGALATGYLLNPLPAANAYKYDQVNRICEATHYQDLTASANTWASTANAIPNQYKNLFIYDDNGNILNQTKYDDAGNLLDNIDYLYNTSGTVGGKLKQNRLYSVKENAAVTANAEDIETPGFNFNIAEATINTANNYSYDEIGNLTKDGYEEISSIKWTVYGKIKEINRPANSTKKSLKFDYDAMGNRIAKHVYAGTSWESSTYYTRDAQGNVMGTYKYGVDCINCPGNLPPIYGLTYKITEHNIYGSSRIGIDEHTFDFVGGNYNSTVYERRVGNKQFEMGNHLGNNLTVVSDRKIPVPDLTSTNTNHFIPQIINATDYYAFGSPMPGRTYVSSSSYRYGFNGKEKDDEVKGSGNSLDFGARIYDPRLGKWLSLDPSARKYPDWSPYKAFKDNPIIYQDPDGRDEFLSIIVKMNGKVVGVGKAIQTSSDVYTDNVNHQIGGEAYYNRKEWFDKSVVLVRDYDENGELIGETKTETLLKDKVRATTSGLLINSQIWATTQSNMFKSDKLLNDRMEKLTEEVEEEYGGGGANKEKAAPTQGKGANIILFGMGEIGDPAVNDESYYPDADKSRATTKEQRNTRQVGDSVIGVNGDGEGNSWYSIGTKGADGTIQGSGKEANKGQIDRHGNDEKK